MKTILQILIVTSALLVASTTRLFAVVGQALEVQGTNLVLSWPTKGYEIYLVQFRPSLDPSNSWSSLTNAYPANSTNRTTYVIPCCALAALGGVYGGGSFLDGGADTLTPNSRAMTDGFSDLNSSATTELWARPKDGSGSAVPLVLYPPGFDTNNLIIFEVPKRQIAVKSISGLNAESSDLGSDGSLGIKSGGCDCPSMGFFQVFHIPNFPAGITNYIFDGPTFIPVDFADYRERVDNIEVLLDGQSTDYATYMSLYYNGQTNWGIGIYFDRIPNGTHTIQLITTLHLNDSVDDRVFLVLSNLTRSIVVDNQVTFTNWDDTIWNNTNYTFRAQLKNTNTDWWIDIYDAWGNWVNGTFGHTTNGIVEWTWDLTDYNGNIRDSLENDPFFDPWITFDQTSSLNGAAGANSQANRPTPIALVPYPSQGMWMIAFQENFYPSGSSGHDYMLEAMYAIQGWVNFRDVPTLFYPIAYGTNSFTQDDRDTDWLTLKMILARGGDFRNFYYFGHGSPNNIGGDLDDYGTNGQVVGCRDLPGSKAHLTSRTAHDEITHNLSTGVHQFRFVWLDGCKTALGDWPDHAFDVNKATNSLSYYSSSVTNPDYLRPSAFVGWATTPGGRDWGRVREYFFYRSEWIREWSYYSVTKSLHDALRDAVSDSTWPPMGEPQLWGGLRVYGYIDLKMNEYNHKNDWPSP